MLELQRERPRIFQQPETITGDILLWVRPPKCAASTMLALPRGKLPAKCAKQGDCTFEADSESQLLPTNSVSIKLGCFIEKVLFENVIKVKLQ